jgi:carbon storage regulator CsrA
MLVLTRKLQEKIRIGDQVTITVLRMKGKAVRLGIEAPASVPVIRGELLYEKIGTATGSTPRAQVASGELPAMSGPAVGSPTDSFKDRTEPAWARDTHPHLPIRRSGCDEPQAEVRFARVPRDKAAQFLARTAPGVGGPLRAMLDERSKAV